MEVITELMETLRTTGGYIVAGTVVMAFLFLAAMLWSNRNVASKDEDDDAQG